ncbi:hypothetical protein SAMN05880558_11765 [Aeromonas sp. RU39B]|jgi:hypothetical protein|uniref:hypothetical protein n=1 Tax=Aeromonas sp. RU39B TaxID=1907416 RepID=UPI000956091A|nr:hypothetical protein [Aeromonas sp. RU39B]SIR57622.1 hypothetical protein SAMN05880558_11765 [Aeromonas sp. RU39B]
MTHIEQLRAITRYLSIAHHIPGRIRLKMKLEALASREFDAIGQVGQLRAMIESMPGIRDLRVNPAALSCVVEYDQSELPASLWESLIKGEECDAVHALLERIALHYQTFARDSE